MENSKNKSIISTGSSNLAKTEKLLSITKKILSEIKPKYESIKIGNQEWMTRNLDVDRFRNGDLIPHVKLDVEWEETRRKGQPAWCYYDNDPENGKKYGKLYNWCAVNDPRGLAPEGWHVPTSDEWPILEDFLGKDFAGHKMKSVEGWEEWVEWLEWEDGELQNGNGDNSSRFKALPSGYRRGNGSFNGIKNSAFFWSSSVSVVNCAWLCKVFNDREFMTRSDLFKVKSAGASIRCIKF